MKKWILLLCTFVLSFGQDISQEDMPQIAFDFLQKTIQHDKALKLSSPDNINHTLKHLKDAFVLYKLEIGQKISENVQLRERVLNGRSEEQLFADSNTFLAGLDFLCLAMASNLSRHYTFALESFGKNEFLDERSQLDKKSLIASLSTLIFMQNLSPYTQKNFSLYADLLLAQNKAYQALEIHKQALSDKEYNFYKTHIVPPPDTLNENAYRTKNTSPFQSLAAVEAQIKESLSRQRNEGESAQHSKRSFWGFITFLWNKATHDYEGNALSGSRYIPVITEIVFLFLYLMILFIGVMDILDSIFLPKADGIDENLNTKKPFGIKNIFLFCCTFLGSNDSCTFWAFSTKNYRLYRYSKLSYISCGLRNAFFIKKNIKSLNITSLQRFCLSFFHKMPTKKNYRAYKQNHTINIEHKRYVA
ncbi:hypothetical protein OQH61_08110 [Helicobacter sp. MIT 21-1697]|uniref:hypothetical protein n=1 Tax=Helicobacter sp. MIT 21-1697 TaxID=2993733 RepID=UPI00224B80C1|nr:hypothetical protein [Helicobacter sp. MIT 21-1697]MCX2717697.1 hypothetical protein [Helicobacter sp. MIT 21-1697]